MARAEVILWAVLLFLLGIIAGGSGVNFLVFLILGLVGLGIFLFWRAPKSVYILLILPLVLGFVYFRFHLALEAVGLRLPENGSMARAVVLGGPVRTSTNWSQFAELQPPFGGTVFIYTDAPRQYGELLEFQARLGEREPGLATPMFATRVKVLGENRGSSIKAVLLALKNSVIARFQAYLPSDHAALLSGLILGERSDLSPELKENMRRSGTTHLVALSGYNISILVVTLGAMLGSIFSRRTRFAAVTLCIIGFVLMTGGEASILRAAFMGFLALLAQQTGRIYSFGHAVVVAAGGMALFEPTLLRLSLGFQLSFLSLLGVAYLSIPMQNFLRLKPGTGDWLAWKENLATTCAAQLAVLPLLLQNFGYFSLSAVLANTLILGLVPFTMFFGFLTALLGVLSFYLGQILAWISYLLLSYEMGVIGIFAKITLPVGNFLPGWAVVPAYYLVLIWFGLKLTSQPHAL